MNNCCKGAVAYLYQDGVTNGITFCDQTSGPNRVDLEAGGDSMEALIKAKWG